MKKQLIWVFEWRKSVYYWWSYILFSPECKEWTSMLDPLLYRWGVPPVVIGCVHWTMQMWALQTWIKAQGLAIVMLQTWHLWYPFILMCRPQIMAIFWSVVIVLINPLRAKFFWGNLNIYLHFMAILHTDLTRVLKTLPQVRKRPTYSIQSISWLLMSPWHWPSQTEITRSPHDKGFNA